MMDLGSSIACGMLFLDRMPGMAIRDALVHLYILLMADSFPQFQWKVSRQKKDTWKIHGPGPYLIKSFLWETRKSSTDVI